MNSIIGLDPVSWVRILTLLYLKATSHDVGLTTFLTRGGGLSDSDRFKAFPAFCQNFIKSFTHKYFRYKCTAGCEYSCRQIKGQLDQVHTAGLIH